MAPRLNTSSDFVSTAINHDHLCRSQTAKTKMVSSRGASSDDDEEEQTLHFKRLSYDAQRLLEVEGGSCLAVHDKVSMAYDLE